MLFLFGCSTSSNQKTDRAGEVGSRLLEKRIDDLSSTITLIVNDANRLHNKMEEMKISNKAIQEKIEGLEATLGDLSNRVASLSSSPRTPEVIQPPAEAVVVAPSVSGADTGKSSDKLKSDIQKTGNVEDRLSVARGFWDAVNANDIQLARSYATKKSAAGLQLKDHDAAGSGRVTLGSVKTEGNKTIIETTLRTYDGETELEVPVETILVKEDGQWKVDFDQTLMSMFGGTMGKMIEGFQKGLEEMGRSLAEGMQKGFEETLQASGTKLEIEPQKQGTATVCGSGEEARSGNIQKGAQEMVQQQGDGTNPDLPHRGQDAGVSREISEQARRELFLKDNILRLAETEFPNNKGIQWNILGFEHKAHLTHVEVEPVPANLDYPRFKFVVSFKNPEMPRVIGMFCCKNGQYILYSAKKEKQ